MGQSLTKHTAVTDPDIDSQSFQSSESPTKASQDHSVPPDLEHGGSLDTRDSTEEAIPPSQSQPEPSNPCKPQSLGEPALPAVDLQALIPPGGIAIKDFMIENHITEENREIAISALEKAAYVKDDWVYCKAEDAERTRRVLSRQATREVPNGLPGIKEPMLMPPASQAVGSSLNQPTIKTPNNGQPTTKTPSNGDLSLPFSVLSRKVDEMHAAMFGTSVVRSTTNKRLQTKLPVVTAPPALINQSTKVRNEKDLLEQAQARLLQLLTAPPSRPLSELNSVPEDKVLILAVAQFCDCEKWSCRAAYLVLANVYTELQIDRKNLRTFQAFHQSILQDVQQHLNSSREALRVSAGKFAATLRALVAALKEIERLQARCELLKAAVQQEEGKSSGYMGWYQAAQERHRQSQALYEAERARHQALLGSLGPTHPSYWQYDPNLANRPAPGFGKRPSLHPIASQAPGLAATTSNLATVDTSPLQILPYFYPGKYEDEAKDNDEDNDEDNDKDSDDDNYEYSDDDNHEENYEDERTTEGVADAPLEAEVQSPETDVQLSKLETAAAKKERDEACDRYKQLAADHDALLANLQDPANSKHLNYENIRLKKEVAVIPKLRSRVKQADQERDELLRLRREAAENSEKAEEADSLLLEYSRVSEAFKNMKEENKTLKTDASEAGVAKLKQDLRKSNAQNDELKQTIKAMEEEQMVTRTGVDSSDEKADPTTRIQLKIAITTSSDSDENDPNEAHRFGLHKFQLTTKTTNTSSLSSSYIKESVRLLKYLTKLHKTVLSRVQNISESRGGLGWSAFEQLEGLLKFMAKETADASKKVLALDRSLAMDASGYPALSRTAEDAGAKEEVGESKRGKAKKGLRRRKYVPLRD
jgi:hypothetical protein